MKDDFELFPGKNLSHIFKDIYNNQRTKKMRISELIADIRKTMNQDRLGDWAIVGTLIKDLVDSSVRNDESLLKLATIAQRLATSSTKVEGEDGFLSDKEKKQLLEAVEIETNKLRETDDIKELEDGVKDIKHKLKKS